MVIALLTFMIWINHYWLLLFLFIQKYCRLALWSRPFKYYSLELRIGSGSNTSLGGYFLAVVLVSHPPLLL